MFSKRDEKQVWSRYSVFKKSVIIDYFYSSAQIFIKSAPIDIKLPYWMVNLSFFEVFVMIVFCFFDNFVPEILARFVSMMEFWWEIDFFIKLLWARNY